MDSSLRLSSLLLVLAALLPIACSDGDGGMMGSDQGNVRVLLTAEGGATAVAAVETASIAAALEGTGALETLPGHLNEDDEGDDVLSQLHQANVTLSSLLARNLEGQLIDLAVDLPRTIDLIGLMDSGQVELPLGSLPPGMYDEIVVVITEVEYVFEDGLAVTLNPPGAGWTRVMPATFEVVEGTITTIELNFDPSSAFREHGGVFQFFPDFACENTGDNAMPKVDVCHFSGHQGDIAAFDCHDVTGCSLVGDGSAHCISVACSAAVNGHGVDTESDAFVAACGEDE